MVSGYRDKETVPMVARLLGFGFELVLRARRLQKIGISSRAVKVSPQNTGA